MNIRNILISGLGVMALTACNDFLDVDAPSKQTVDAVFSSSQEVNAALNGVYAKVMVNDGTSLPTQTRTHSPTRRAALMSRPVALQ